jgi:hypothetical protein
MVTPTPTPPVVPANASTTTKILISIAFVLGIVATATFPTSYSPVIGMWAGVLGGLAAAAAVLVHTVWDHS